MLRMCEGWYDYVPISERHCIENMLIFPTTVVPYFSPVNKPTHKGRIVDPTDWKGRTDGRLESPYSKTVTQHTRARLEVGRRERHDTEHTKIAPETAARDDWWRIQPPARVVAIDWVKSISDNRALWSINHHRPVEMFRPNNKVDKQSVGLGSYKCKLRMMTA